MELEGGIYMLISQIVGSEKISIKIISLKGYLTHFIKLYIALFIITRDPPRGEMGSHSLQGFEKHSKFFARKLFPTIS